MKDSRWTMLAVKTVIWSVLGLSAMPLLCVIVQYIDSMSGFTPEQGTPADYMYYFSTAPVIYIVVALCVLLILAIAYLVYCFRKEKKDS